MELAWDMNVSDLDCQGIIVDDLKDELCKHALVKKLTTMINSECAICKRRMFAVRSLNVFSLSCTQCNTFAVCLSGECKRRAEVLLCPGTSPASPLFGSSSSNRYV